MRNFLLLLLFSASLQTYAQNLAGVWEGSVLLEGSKNHKLNLRLEIIQQEGAYYGILYSRGSDKGIVYGCDFFVSANSENGKVVFNWQKVQRSVGMKESECRMVDHFEMVVSTRSDSTMAMNGFWVWQSGNSDRLGLTKVSNNISDMTTDEINEYIRQLYEAYEISGIKLPTESRLVKKAYTQAVENSPLVVQFSTVDSSANDSISVYVNDNLLASMQSLIKKPVRLRFESMQSGDYEIVIVNESETKNRIKVNVKIMQLGEVKEITVTPTYTINPLILFTRKED